MNKRKLLCPQCGISNLYLKDPIIEERINVYIYSDKTIETKSGEIVTEKYSDNTIFCLGCSWSGSISRLVKFVS